MAIDLVALNGSTGDSTTTDSSTFSSSSVSPTGDAVLVWVAAADPEGALPDPTVSGLGLTWSKVSGGYYEASDSGFRTGWWYLGEGTISAPDTVDFDFGASTFGACFVSVLDVSGVDTSDIVVQVSPSDTGTGTLICDTTLSAFADATNNVTVVGVMTNRGSGGSLTGTGSLTTLMGQAAATPTTRTGVFWQTGENTAPRVDADVSCKHMIAALEIAVAPAGGTDRAGRIYHADMRVPFEHYSDTFDRTAAELGNLEHNSTGTTIAWTDIEDDFAVDGDHAYVPSPTMPGEPTATLPGWADGIISADIHTSATSNRVNVGLAFRVDAANHYLFVKLENSSGHGAGVLDIMSFGEGGGGSTILDTQPCVFTEGDVIHIIVTFDGDQITAEAPDLGVTASYTLTAPQMAEFTGTDFGLRMRAVSDEDDGGSEWNFFSARDLTDHVGRIYWAEMEAPDSPRAGRVFWAELETDDAPRSGRVFWAEMETDDAPRSGRLFWAELEADDAPRAGQLFWAELQVPDVADTDRAGQLFWAEMETGDAPRLGRIFWAEMEAPDAPRAGRIFWAEMEADDPSVTRAGRIFWAEIEIPTQPRAGRIYFAELAVMNTSADGKDGWIVWRHSSQPQSRTNRPFRRPYGTRFGSRP